ncbi:biotin transporter BioY [Bacillus pumilus]|nr:biotin transporter BioY [Bacillus pumilus]
MLNIREMMHVALLTAVMGILGIIPPIFLSFTPVPITLQTAGVLLAGGILKPKQAFMSLCLFLFIVAAGAPLLSGGRGGFGVFFGPSGGFLMAYPIVAIGISFWIQQMSRYSVMRFFGVYVACSIGILYSVGVPFQSMIMNIPIKQAAWLSFTYIPGDLLKAILCAVLTIKIRQALSYQERLMQKGGRIY